MATGASMTTQLWRSTLELAIMGMLSLQELGHELLLALYALRVRGARFALPDNTNNSSTANTSTAGPTTSSPSHRKRRLAAMEFLEKFRRGPENQSEWNLFLWRVTFPMVTLVLFTLFAVVGKMGHAFYSLLVCPLWYLCNFVLVVYPFDVVFRFPDIDRYLQSGRGLWKALALVSVFVSAVEWYVSSPKSRFSWIVGNTLFGVVALIAIPLFFTSQSRIPREHGSALPQEDLQQQQSQQSQGDLEQQSHHASSIASLPTAEVLLPISPTSSSMRLRTSTTDFAGAEGASRDPQEFADDNDTVDPSSSLLLSPRAHSHQSHQQHQKHHSTHATIKRPPPANKKSSQLMSISAACIVVVWLAMFTSYNSSRGAPDAGGDAGVAGKYWFLTYLLSPVLCIVLFCTRQQNTNFSFDHVMVYGMLIVHIPVFLGHFCIRLFAMAEDSGNHGSSWMKLGISVLYLLVMQGYFFVITHVVNAMAEPFAHPSLLYIGQLYYYLFWYILVGSDTPIDALYWGMLLVNNVHIAFLNTGIYTDVKRSSWGCTAMPLNLSVGSSVAVCFRASTTAHSRSDNESSARTAAGSNSSVPGFAHHSAGEGDDDDEDEQQYASESDGFLSDQDGVLPVFVKSRRPPVPNGSNTYEGTSPHQQRSTTNGSSPHSSSAVIGCPSAVAAIRDQCSLDGSNKRNNGRKKRGANIVLSSHRSSMEHLKPLYFLMKLAEQDNMADTTALILVPSLLTLMAVFEKPSEGIAILYDQMNMWIRCICMFIGRLGGAYLAREIFAYKLKSRLRSAGNNAIGTIEGMSTRLWIQRLMLQDFHRQFWYLMVVTIVVTFACFDRVDLPLRFALLT